MFKHGASYLQGGDFRSIAIVYQIPSMNASVLCSRISPLGATGDLCKDTAKCRHLHIAHIFAYMCLLRRRSDATPCKRSVHYRATLQGVRRAGPCGCFAVRATRSPNPTPSYPPAEGCPRSGCPSRGARANLRATTAIFRFGVLEN